MRNICPSGPKPAEFLFDGYLMESTQASAQLDFIGAMILDFHGVNCIRSTAAYLMAICSKKPAQLSESRYVLNCTAEFLYDTSPVE